MLRLVKCYRKPALTRTMKHLCRFQMKMMKMKGFRLVNITYHLNTLRNFTPHLI